MECPICIQEMDENGDDIVTLDCGHTFHLKCIHMWLNVNNTCPNCRKIVIKEFKCKYSPYPFLPFVGKKNCVFKIKENSIIIHFDNAHLRTSLTCVILKSDAIGEGMVLKHKVGENRNGSDKIKTFSYDFSDLRFAMNTFSHL